MSTPIDLFKAAQQNTRHGNVEDDGKNIQYWQDKLVGKTYIGGGSAGALEEDQVVRDSQLPAIHRVARINTMLTMDYRPTRLNVKIDENNKILAVSFG
ncbi:hypothetical protein BC937DRAFT_86502 [Endogone sp. FLAS-F59071]|nr:hypothetical protein BC937DRAFT_86502 [Endogone sp. FLAS-F59071]|eukprot:RUS20041.1 hypothetical protein BC937DRAFT_86502 [Endogone sp. FLAS-F59071]